MSPDSEVTVVNGSIDWGRPHHSLSVREGGRQDRLAGHRKNGLEDTREEVEAASRKALLEPIKTADAERVLPLKLAGFSGGTGRVVALCHRIEVSSAWVAPPKGSWRDAV